MPKNHSYNTKEYKEKQRISHLGKLNGRYKVKRGLSQIMISHPCKICGEITRNTYFCSDACKGIASIHNTCRFLRNKNYFFNNVQFHSKREMEIAMCLFYQFNISLKERINCHVIVNKKEIDFIINELYTVIEVHPKMFGNNLEYCKERLQIIQNSKYKYYKFILIE